MNTLKNVHLIGQPVTEKPFEIKDILFKDNVNILDISSERYPGKTTVLNKMLSYFKEHIRRIRFKNKISTASGFGVPTTYPLPSYLNKLNFNNTISEDYLDFDIMHIPSVIVYDKNKIAYGKIHYYKKDCVDVDGTVFVGNDSKLTTIVNDGMSDGSFVGMFLESLDHHIYSEDGNVNTFRVILNKRISSIQEEMFFYNFRYRISSIKYNRETGDKTIMFSRREGEHISFEDLPSTAKYVLEKFLKFILFDVRDTIVLIDDIHNMTANSDEELGIYLDCYMELSIKNNIQFILGTNIHTEYLANLLKQNDKFQHIKVH